MANTFKNALAKNVGTTVNEVYSPASGVTSTVIGMSTANVTSVTCAVTVSIFDASVSVTANVVLSSSIEPGSTLVAVGADQKIVLETSDAVSVVSDTTSSIDVVLSFLEQT